MSTLFQISGNIGTLNVCVPFDTFLELQKLVGSGVIKNSFNVFWLYIDVQGK